MYKRLISDSTINYAVKLEILCNVISWVLVAIGNAMQHNLRLKDQGIQINFI